MTRFEYPVDAENDNKEIAALYSGSRAATCVGLLIVHTSRTAHTSASMRRLAFRSAAPYKDGRLRPATALKSVFRRGIPSATA